MVPGLGNMVATLVVVLKHDYKCPLEFPEDWNGAFIFVS
jgi:hypothetical protein